MATQSLRIAVSWFAVVAGVGIFFGSQVSRTFFQEPVRLEVAAVPAPATKDSSEKVLKQSVVKSTASPADVPAPVPVAIAPPRPNLTWVDVGDHAVDWLVKLVGCVSTLLGAISLYRLNMAKAQHRSGDE